MSNEQIIRAWKDASYRSSLGAAEIAQLPAHPAGLVELSDAQLNAVSGGNGPVTKPTLICGTTHPHTCF
jgi:mersacidin/lichenicidin family type 2 lantibiotic